MNVLRNIFSNRALNYLRQNGQNALINITQPVETAGGAEHDNNNATTNNNTTPAITSEKRPTPLLIPRSILDATTFTGKKFSETAQPTAAPATGSISPTTLKRFRRIERKVELVYRCKLCNTRNSKLVTEAAYKTGVVILQCDGCAVNHLIIDNLGWFANTRGKSFDQVLAEKGERIKVIKVNEHGDLI